MKFGAVYPQAEFGSDPALIREFAQTVESLGYTHIVAYDHVLGANPERPGGWQGPYTYKTVFMEPFLLFSYMAAITTRVGFLTGIIILPQRQTALVAKQAATLDVLCGGKFRLGVGNGWNPVEYEGLGQDFHTRGKRIEEQTALLRELWTRPLVQFSGRWDTIPDAGINPLPLQQPIPIWFGGQSETALRRIARLADGWLPNQPDMTAARPYLDMLDRFLAEAGRARPAFGVEARIPYKDGNPDAWQATIRGWEDAGVSQGSFNTLGIGPGKPQAHLEALRTFAQWYGIKA